jgi:8-oxo-dGTP pyrophosphatase MutT (NUDIX family)
LVEETGLTVRREPTPVAILFDPVIRTWEMVFQVVPEQGDEVSTPEYDELRWCRREDLPATLTPTARQMVELWPTTAAPG